MPSIMISEFVGNLLRKLLSHSIVFVSIQPGQVEYITSSPSKSSVYFVAFAFISVILVTFIWLTIYYIQKFRYLNTKRRLDVSIFFFIFLLNLKKNNKKLFKIK